MCCDKGKSADTEPGAAMTLVGACPQVVTYTCVGDACTSVTTLFDANGEGNTTDTMPEPITEDEKEAVCDAGINNQDDSLKSQCRLTEETVTDVWDALNEVCFSETKRVFFDGTESPQYTTTVLDAAICCSNNVDPAACATSYTVDAGQCKQIVNGLSSNASSPDLCCLEGWEKDDESLKSVCNIQSIERSFDETTNTCTLISTDIFPNMNNEKETVVHSQDCCENAGTDEGLLKACTSAAREKTVFRRVADIGF